MYTGGTWENTMNAESSAQREEQSTRNQKRHVGEITLRTYDTLYRSLWNSSTGIWKIADRERANMLISKRRWCIYARSKHVCVCVCTCCVFSFSLSLSLCVCVCVCVYLYILPLCACDGQVMMRLSTSVRVYEDRGSGRHSTV